MRVVVPEVGGSSSPCQVASLLPDIADIRVVWIICFKLVICRGDAEQKRFRESRGGWRWFLHSMSPSCILLSFMVAGSQPFFNLNLSLSSTNLLTWTGVTRHARLWK